ncbi:MAG: helix-turn-helix domain-containing protein [Chloroflexi bacterium]|nr:MAG: helix-turn-helix domain-containing protein [Chloroflexota bacterium]
MSVRLFESHEDRPTLGFLLASLHTGSSRALWPGLLDAAERHNVNLISFPGGRLNASIAYESQRNLVFDLANSESIDGLVTWASSLGGVLSPSETSAFHQRYQGLPMVSLAQFMEGLPTVALDSYQGMRSLLKHLIEVHGFERLAFIRGPEEHYYAQERYRAYLDTLQAYNLPLVPELITRPLRWESGVEAVQILLDERGLVPGADFQAVVAVSDMLALWALKSLQSRGFEVPGDVAVTGFNDSIEERLATPPLTTVNLPFYDQGAKAIDLLSAQLSGETIPALITLPSSLVVRQSCGCASKAVQMAAYLPRAEPATLEKPGQQLHEQFWRQFCLEQMAEAAGRDSDQNTAMFSDLLDGLLGDLQGAPNNKTYSSIFLQKMGEALDDATQRRQDLNLWNGVISVLRFWVLPGMAIEQHPALETLLGQARVMISEAILRSQAYWQWQAERQTDILREINRALLTTFDIDQLCDVLFEHLPGLGIASAYLVLYENPSEPAGYSRLMMAYTEQGRASIDPSGWRFPTSQLVPREFLPQQRRYSMVVEPLYFQEKPLGYAVFENGPRDGNIYELVRGNLSSAIQGARLFEEIQKARLLAEKGDRIKTRLLANVSHELRTPLNIIIGITQSMLEPSTVLQPLPAVPAFQNDIQSIQDHAEHQLRVINDLLDLSRAEIDELDLSLELIDPLPLLHEAFHAIADHSTNPEIDWRLDLPERLPLIRADAVRLRQILLNLLSNARKFTTAGHVILGAEVAPPYVHFWTSDTGLGIPPEQQERIFEPFVAIEQDQRIAGGIGLGLSITRHLVALHGGKMNLESEIGKGSKFNFHIPLPALEQDKVNIENTQPVLLLLSSSGRPAEEIQAICRRQELQICLVTNLAELEAAFSNTRPLAVAWDLTGARPGDWDLVRRLRHHPSISQAPFIVYGQQPHGSSLALGLTSFVVKSPNRQTMLDTLNTLCPANSTGALLIVDDDPEARQSLQSLAEQGLPGCTIHQAGDGEMALAFMEHEVPALVLLDMVMPGLSGADVLDQMRADPRLRQVPVVILSRKSLTQEDVRRLEHHARVIFQSKGVWTEAETISALNRALFGTDTLPAHTSALVKGAISYMHQNYSRSFSRWEVAETIGVSEDYLTRVFNRELEISPWDYLNRYRILQSMTLLRETDQSIGTIAHAVGFKDQAYFSRVFRQQNGLSPQAFRDSG